MKKNKELKKGDKIWYWATGLAESEYFPVQSVKKKGTLVEVVVEAYYFSREKKYEIKLYGHASSSLLSGYDKKWRHQDICYTCDYELVKDKTARYDHDKKYIDAGRAVLDLVKCLKEK